MNEYLMWRLVAGYMPYLPEQDRAPLDVLRAELTGQSGTGSGRARRRPHGRASVYRTF